ncbi:hypothetical protein LMG28614_04539 [Paraburkholderia ultramafica]|uniref:FAD dependent oxidoreductase domain-containing protein n=1 Tax=Paraburkholderia ultramafica TaxID=1544867 RepID=A0A6S7BY03_9BURK|nr:hypothetical protein LMG28614_04539 [Paraburkholderia ultramafica]
MRVIIVAAGIAGLSTAWSLARLGHDTTLIEQGSIPNPLAPSGDRHRMIRRAQTTMSDANALFIPQQDDIDEPAMTRAALACIDGFTAALASQRLVRLPPSLNKEPYT